MTRAPEDPPPPADPQGTAPAPPGETLPPPELETTVTPSPAEAGSSPSVLPTRLGGFEVESELARGGMGVVYRARSARLGRPVALKTLLSGVFATPEALERFQIEARAAARLRHPSIVGVHEVGEESGLHYIAMDFIEGESLAQRIRRDGPLEPTKAARLLERLADACTYAHSRGEIHRDLKPANVILTAGDEPVLTDFGLAKEIDSGEGPTRSGQAMGTPAYMPPEQAVGELDRIDRRSDIYSLGATFYHLLAGRAPFEAPTPVGVVMKHASEPLPDLRTFATDVPPRVRDLLNRMMAKKADDRFATYADLTEALRAVRPQASQPAGFLVRGVAMLVDFVPWLMLSEINEWLLFGFPIYLAVSHTVFGRTLGKALFRLKVADEHGDRPKPARALARAVGFAWIFFALIGVMGMNQLLLGGTDLSMDVAPDTVRVTAGGEEYEGERSSDGSLSDVVVTTKEGQTVPAAAWAMLAVVVALVALWLTGLLVAGFDPRKRAFHDRLANTRVLYSTD